MDGSFILPIFILTLIMWKEALLMQFVTQENQAKKGCGTQVWEGNVWM